MKTKTKPQTKTAPRAATRNRVAPELRRAMRMVGTRRARVPHSTRPAVNGAAHVVLKIRRGLPSLRTPRAWRVLERAFRASQSKDGFRLVHFSVQRDHMHLVVEADDRGRLARALQGLTIRIAKRLNRHWHRKVGAVFADRYFANAIESYSQWRRTVAYVLGNGRRHGERIERGQPDPYSSGRWFQWWDAVAPIRRALRRAPVEKPRTYQLFVRLPIDHVPGPASWAVNHGVTSMGA